MENKISKFNEIVPKVFKINYGSYIDISNLFQLWVMPNTLPALLII